MPDNIAQIELISGDAGHNYDFCEFEPVTLSGVVYHDQNDNGRREPGEEGLGDSEIRLVGDNGEVVATTHTSAEGTYQFIGPYAGTYSLHQIQPEGWLDGRATVQGPSPAFPSVSPSIPGIASSRSDFAGVMMELITISANSCPWESQEESVSPRPVATVICPISKRRSKMS